jgi:hypothetical protein
VLRVALIAAVALHAAACSCGEDGASAEVVLGFEAACGGADGCDLDLSCLGAVSFRVWTPGDGERVECIRGGALDGIETGCDLDRLDVVLPIGDDETAVVVEVLGFAGDDCAPEEGSESRLLFAGLSAPAAVDGTIALTLSCTAGCAAGNDGCDGATDCTCCAGVCVDDDAMLHCLGCFRPCDPYRADECDDGECRCGGSDACDDDEVCCAGACLAVGSCPPVECPFTADEEDCTNPATDAHDCGGGLGADSCPEGRADACLAGGCTCGGGPACAETLVCTDGACVEP